MSGAQQAIVTDLDEAWWEHMLEEAADELLGGDGATLELISGRLFVSESDRALLQRTDAVVADSDAKDVGGEILEGLLAGAHGCGMDHPVFLPERGRYWSKQFRLLEGLAEPGAEDWGKGFDGQQKVWACRAPAAVSREAARR